MVKWYKDKPISNIKICELCGSKVNSKYSIRSNQQNRYLWGIVYKLISDHCGFTVEEIHELCKQKFLTHKIFILMKNESVKEYSVPESTRDIDTVAMEDYMSKIRQWASEDLGMYIPIPNEGIE